MAMGTIMTAKMRRLAVGRRALHVNSSAFAPAETRQTSAYAQTHAAGGVINFGLGQPSPALLPLELMGRAAAHRFQARQDRVLLQYGAAKGFDGFRESIAGFLSGGSRLAERVGA
jgi:DNA-binding transcriptional MocR family regulator